MSRLTDAKNALLRAGGSLTDSKLRGALVRADSRAKKEAEAYSAPPNKAAADWIRRALGWLAVGFFMIALVGGVAAILIVIPAAEFVAVYEGLYLITPSAPIAGLTTAALFVGAVVLMFLKHVYEDALPNGKPLSGLRRLMHSAGAWLGFASSEKWIDAFQFKKIERDYLILSRALGFAKFAILGASLLGRLKTTFQAHALKPIGEALSGLAAEVTGQEVIGAVISLVVLFAALRLLEMGVLFAYTAFKNSAGKLDLAEARPVDFLELYSVLKEDYQAEAVEDITREIQIKAENLASEIQIKAENLASEIQIKAENQKPPIS